MPDIRKERCQLIADSISAINVYMQPIQSAKSFIESDEGSMRLDAITLRLQVIGENVKQLEGLYPSFFDTDVPYDVSEIIRFRDFISHHYEKLDYQIIYETCISYLSDFHKAIDNYLQSFSA